MHKLEEKRMKTEGTLRSIDTLSNLLRKDYHHSAEEAPNSHGMSTADEEIIRKKVIELVKSIEI